MTNNAAYTEGDSILLLTKHNPDDTTTGKLSLLSLWRVVSARKWFILAVTAAFMVLALVLTSRGDRTYTAETLLVLENNNTDLTNSISRSAVSYENSTNAIEVFGSRRVIENVVDRMNLMDNPQFNPFLTTERDATPSVLSRVFSWVMPTPEPPEVVTVSEARMRQATVAVVQKRVRFLADPRSNIIRIAASTSDPAISADLANKTAEAFLRDLLETRMGMAERVVEQLGRRVSDLRREVSERQTALQDFMSSSKTIDQNLLTSLGDEAVRMRTRLEAMQAQQENARNLMAQIEALTGQPRAEIDAAIAASPELSRLAVSTGLRDPGSQLSRIAQETRGRMDQQDRLATALKESLVTLERRINTQGQQLIELQQLQRDADASAEIYEFSVRRLNELSVQSGIEVGGGRVVFAANKPQLPDGRGRPRVMVILGLLGMMTALGWVLVREATNQTVRSLQDLKTVISGPRIVGVPKAANLALLKDASSPYSEAIRRLRAVILDQNPAGNALTIHMASDLISVGKAAQTLALARSCALIGKRVLVIDANMRNGRIPGLLKLSPPKAGLQTALKDPSGLSGLVIRSTDLGVDLLLAEQEHQNPADILEESGGLDALIAAARDIYQIILIDTPPVLAAPDAKLVSRHADCTVLVISSNVSTRQSIEDAVTDLADSLSDQDIVSFYGDDIHQQSSQKSYRRAFRKL